MPLHQIPNQYVQSVQLDALHVSLLLNVSIVIQDIVLQTLAILPFAQISQI